MSLFPQVYVNIKDEVVNFFHAQGITIVTIQPEFNTKSTDDTKNKDKTGLLQPECLIGCQSIECAPKTCCSTNDLDAILIDGCDKKKKKLNKPSKTDRKSSSMLSLNVSSLIKSRKFTESTQDVIKKSVSESHVAHICCSDDNNSTDSQIPSTTASSTVNHLYSIDNSIDELKENEFHEQCDKRSEQRLPSTEKLSQSQQLESLAEHEDSSLLDKLTPSSPAPAPSTHINEMKSSEEKE